jgi:hypothetical protein
MNSKVVPLSNKVRHLIGHTRFTSVDIMCSYFGTWRYFRLANSNSQRDVEFTYLD